MSKMHKVILGLLVSITMSACSSDEKKVETGDVEGDPSIVVSKDFDPTGSDSGKIQGLQTVNFEYDKSRLTSEARKALAGNAEWIRNKKNVTVQVEGHCDSRGSVEYNLALGERRAKSVKNYLVSLGVQANRLTIISYGKEKPIDSSDSEDAFNKNRRANFVPLPN